MSRAPSDLEPRSSARFSASAREAILLRQSFEGADGIRISCCDECSAHIARLMVNGRWTSLRPHAFDHSLPRGLYGPTSVVNGRAVCDHPFECHKIKSAGEVASMVKADKQAGRIGQQARRAARKARGLPSLLQGRGFQKHV